MTDSPLERDSAAAHPTKAFFVRMLTRDISLEDCILDLVDNSVDAAWKNTKLKPIEIKKSNRLSKFRVDIVVSEDRFSITDNCGGISLEDAADYAFTFGRKDREDEDDETDAYTVGVYGIGMKRAVFKLGNLVRVNSTPSEEPHSFSVPINVADWMRPENDEWDFPIEPADKLDDPGVEISVAELSDETSRAFSDPAFERQLRRKLERDYLLPLMHGLEISLNGRDVKGWDVTFRESRDFKPMRERYDEGEVSIEIIAGMTTSPPDDSGPSDRNQEDGSGWYVICNGRVVVARDRTDLTVWGRDKFPNWHPQYKGFIGIVLFASRDAALLPMTTTKRSVDTSSSLYRRAITRMQRPTREWITYTNAWKNRRAEARPKEESAKAVPITSVKPRKKIKLPPSASGPKDANILFTMPKQRVVQLGTAFGKSTMTNKEVGERSFEYAFERLVGDDE